MELATASPQTQDFEETDDRSPRIRQPGAASGGKLIRPTTEPSTASPSVDETARSLPQPEAASGGETQRAAPTENSLPTPHREKTRQPTAAPANCAGEDGRGRKGTLATRDAARPMERRLSGAGRGKCEGASRGLRPPPPFPRLESLRGEGGEAESERASEARALRGV